MKISTKTGDKGESGLYNGRRKSKGDLIFEALGDLDELNSMLGWCSLELDEEEEALLQQIQEDTYKLMSLVGFEMKCPKETVMLSDEDVRFLEENIEFFEEQVGDLRNFVRPGTCEAAARLHMARGVARRAERSLVKYVEGKLKGASKPELTAEEELRRSEIVLKYINRLSDLLFIMACSYESNLERL